MWLFPFPQMMENSFVPIVYKEMRALIDCRLWLAEYLAFHMRVLRQRQL